MTGDEDHFELWLAEFDETRPPGSATEEETLDAIARVIFTEGWTLEAEEPCDTCGLPCQYRRGGRVVHPLCPDMPPGLTWDEIGSGTARFRELLDSLRLGYGLSDHGPCAGCGRPTRYRDRNGEPRHPRCAPARADA